MGCKPSILLADAGYFSYDNLELLKRMGIDAYIPDNFFKVEERGKSKWFRKSIFKFNEEKDCYYCPAGILMPFTRIQKRKDKPDLKQYVGVFFQDCIFKKACTKAENVHEILRMTCSKNESTPCITFFCYYSNYSLGRIGCHYFGSSKPSEN